MKSLFHMLFAATSLIIVSCAQHAPISNTVSSNGELLRFAKANCFFWYFKKMDYDLTDIGSITGGIVEKGSYSAESYQNVAFLVREYEPAFNSKNDIDIDLLKCFKLESDEQFLLSLEKLK